MSQVLHPAKTGITQTPAGNFDCLARIYRWMELFTFGPCLARCRNKFLPECTSCRRALVLGDGDGRFTAQLLRINPTIEIDAVDVSAKMLDELLRRSGPHRNRVQTHCADIRDFRPPNPPYDLITAHFFLDCFETEEIHVLASTLRCASAEDARLIVSDFSIAKGWSGWLIARPVLWFLYRAFAVLTGLAVRKLPDHQAALRQASFVLKRREPRLHHLLISELWTPKS